MVKCYFFFSYLWTAVQCSVHRTQLKSKLYSHINAKDVARCIFFCPPPLGQKDKVLCSCLKNMTINNKGVNDEKQ